ncbi:hypothetical protein BASA50_007056 [Batrachochytrium salamandrivorans]|uniref:Centrosomal protein of 70 kDa n=1 Tax=Batrachochytrium salamandrivorans TaxID=1357716 RepID=A0ABQ8F7Z7_9FUNG|nr:hypothetical protein BASA50_007056 [Batrachochytrium salamandrivorans]
MHRWRSACGLIKVIREHSTCPHISSLLMEFILDDSSDPALLPSPKYQQTEHHALSLEQDEAGISSIFSERDTNGSSNTGHHDTRLLGLLSRMDRLGRLDSFNPSELSVTRYPSAILDNRPTGIAVASSSYIYPGVISNTRVLSSGHQPTPSSRHPPVEAISAASTSYGDPLGGIYSTSGLLEDCGSSSNTISSRSDLVMVTGANSTDSLISLPASTTTSFNNMASSTTADSQMDLRTVPTATALDSESVSDVSVSSTNRLIPGTSSVTPISGYQSGTSNLRLGLARPRTHESLERQMQLLRLSNQELIAANQASTQSYESRIKDLSNLISDTQAQSTNTGQLLLEKTQQIEYLQNQLQRHVLEGSKKDAGISWTDSSTSESALNTHLNTELLRENSQLRDQLAASREEVDHLRLLVDIGSGRCKPEYSDTPSKLENTSLESSAAGGRAVSYEVGRILHGGNHYLKSASSEMALLGHATFLDKGTLTDKNMGSTDELQTEQNVVISDLKEEREWLLKALEKASAKNTVLNKNLDELKTTILELESKFNQLMGEAEVAMATERITRETIEEQKETIAQYADQVLDLAKQIEAYRDQVDRLHEEHKKYKHAQSILHRMNQMHAQHLKANLPDRFDPDSGRMKKEPASGQNLSHADSLSNPIAMVEMQWLADRRKDQDQIEMLQKTIQGLERENRATREKLEASLATMHSESEWVLMFAKLTVSQDECTKANSKIESLGCVIEILQSQISLLESAADEYSKEKKTLKDRIAKIKEDLTIRDKSLKIAQSRLVEYEKDINKHEIRSKRIRSHYIGGNPNGNTEIMGQSTVDGVHDEVKACRLEISKKLILIRQWKTKANSLEKEMSTLKSATQNLIDPKMCEALQSHLKLTRQRVKDAETYVSRYTVREQQFIEAVKQLTMFIHQHIPPVDMNLFSKDATNTKTSGIEGCGVQDNETLYDTEEVIQAAREISKRYLQVDLCQILVEPQSRHSTDVMERLKAILNQDVFKDDLVGFIVDMLQMYI